MYLYIYIEKRTFCVFCKRTKNSRVLLRSSQKKVAFFAFFYVLCKRLLHSLHSSPFLRKERKRTHRSFGFYKSPKTQKKEWKRMLRSLKERKRMGRSERKRTRCPTLLYSMLVGGFDIIFLLNRRLFSLSHKETLQ